MDQQQAQQFAFMLEVQCAKCAQDDRARPDDVDNLTVWGQALMELCMFKNEDEANDLIAQSVQKLEKAAKLRPNSPPILFSLAQALNMTGLNNPDKETAEKYFKLSMDKMQELCELEPTNLEYRKTMDNFKKAPEVWDQVQQVRQLERLKSGGSMGAGGPKTRERENVKARKKSSQRKYDTLGYIILAVAFFVLARRGPAAAH